MYSSDFIREYFLFGEYQLTKKLTIVPSSKNKCQWSPQPQIEDIYHFPYKAVEPPQKKMQEGWKISLSWVRAELSLLDIAEPL